MKTKTFLWFLFACVISPPLCAQQNQKLDSLLRVYASQENDSLKVQTSHVLYDLYYGHQPKLALQYSQEGLDLAQKIDYKNGIAKSYYHKGRQFRNTRKLDSANIYFQKSLELYKEIGNDHEVGMMICNKIIISHFRANYDSALTAISETFDLYSKPNEDSIIIMNLLDLRGRVYMRQTKYKEGIESALEALGYAEKLNSENKEAQIIGLLASLYHYTNNKAKSISYKQEALKIYQKQNRKRQVANTLNDIGNSYYMLGQYDLALEYLLQSLPISKELELNGLIGITTFNVGKTYIRKGEIKKGIDYLEESIHYSQNISHNPLSESWALKKLGTVYIEELNMPEKAMPLLNRAIILADSVGNKDDLYQSYKHRANAYAMMGDYKKAYTDHEMYKAINDSVYNIERSKEIERLKTEFDTEKNEQQIALQEQEITVLEQKASISNLQRLLMAIALLLSLIGFYALRQKMKRNKLEREKVDAELAFKKKELTTHALNLARKNETLENLKTKAQALKETEGITTGYNQLIRTINFDLQDDNNWENFSRYFEEVHKDFNGNVKSRYPDVSSNELRLLALLKMNLSSKEIANILNISSEGIKKARYRLRKKLNITTEDSLHDLVLNL